MLHLLLLLACADPFGDAQKANTIEAWEAYLKDGSPSLSQKLTAEQNLQALLLDRARKTKSVADYDALLTRFEKLPDRKALQQERAEASFAQADKEGTPEAWRHFLDDNKGADSILIKKATNMIAVAEYKGKLVVDSPRVEQVNLAENPAGPKDGWGFFAKVSNQGDKTIEFLNMEVRLLDESGNKLKAWQWPLVSKTGPGNMPIQEEYTFPLKPGESREWEYTTGDIPEGWSKKVAVVPVSIRFAGATPEP